MANNEGFEITSKEPGWIKKKVPDTYADDSLIELVLFYVINTPCTDLSSSSISILSYGWKKDVWKKGKLKEALFDVAKLIPQKTFISAKKTDEMKVACRKAKLTEGFYKNRNEERIAIYKPSRYNEFLAICYHIRNSFAHGRLAMHAIKGNPTDIMFVLEDGVPYNGQFQVRSRMLLKRSTLLTWMKIIQKGKLEDGKDG